MRYVCLLVLTLPLLSAQDGAAIYKERCASCHDADQVKSTRATKEQWAEIVSRMNDKGASLSAKDSQVLVDYLAKKQIPVELCVLSNVRTAVVPEVACHPARTYYERGIPLSINTDDPKMFGNSLAEEYLALQQHLGFSRADIRRLIEQAIETSWLGELQKGDLLSRIRSEFAHPGAGT